MFFWPHFKTTHLKIVFLILIFLAVLYNVNFFSYFNIFSSSYQSQKHLITCYFEKKHPNTLLELDPKEVAKNSIFFIETSCNHQYGIRLNLRQGCAVESAAKLNPNLQIYVLFVAPGVMNNESFVINRLKGFKNVNLRYINFVKYAHKSPLQDFVASNKIFTSRWPVSHTSDLLRFLTLWKFGGTYLDLDVVLMKLVLNSISICYCHLGLKINISKLYNCLFRSLEGMTNFVSIESTTAIASLALNFDTDVSGKTVANIAVHDFAENYRGDDWGYNGPGVITRALQRICNTDIVSAN